MTAHGTEDRSTWIGSDYVLNFMDWKNLNGKTGTYCGVWTIGYGFLDLYHYGFFDAPCSDMHAFICKKSVQ